MAVARPPVTPRLHPMRNIISAIGDDDLWGDAVRESMAWLGLNGFWSEFYKFSEITSVEVSMLIDAEDNCFVDWGTESRVGLNPPAGGIVPFKVWVHTHPFGSSYWSATDRNTLAIASAARILDSALVLGRGESKMTHWFAEGTTPSLADSGPLHNWSEEAVKVCESEFSPWEVEVKS